jgi:hypothetical protein
LPNSNTSVTCHFKKILKDPLAPATDKSHAEAGLGFAGNGLIWRLASCKIFTNHVKVARVMATYMVRQSVMTKGLAIKNL